MKKLGLIIISIIIALNLIINIYQVFAFPKTGFVRSSDLVYGYQGMIEMQNLYQDKIDLWQSQYDTLKYDYQLTAEKFESERPNLTDEEKGIRINVLNKKKNDIVRYEKSIEDRASEEEKKMLQSVLAKINSFIKDYGEKYGYTIIFGTTNDGSILYGEDCVDITDDVLKKLNSQYNL